MFRPLLVDMVILPRPKRCRFLGIDSAALFTFFFNIFFIKGPFFYFHARKLAYQGEMKCLSNVILTRVYICVRKCNKRC